MDTPPTPDATQGVFETLLVVDGAPIELDAHLDRLATSLGALFGAALPAGLADRIAERTRGQRLGRMRITVAPTLAGQRAELASEDVDPADFFPARERGAKLSAHFCAGGLGRHKWADRRPLEGVSAGTVPLLFDRGDEILEAGRANLFAVVGQVLRTPAADGRILPGIARAGAIAAAREAGIEVLEQTLTRADLLAADEVFLTGSVRGVEPARSLDGVPLPAAAPISRRVAAGLRQRWLGAALAAAPVPAAAPPPGQPAR